MATENRIGVWNWGKMYIPAKYLQSTGTQWIDTEITHDSKTWVELEACPT